jgi:DnaJ-class molecular chaperone
VSPEGFGPASLKDEVAMDGRRARKVLGVARDASPDDIRRAFRARAQVTHPDHGGTADAFAETLAAYAVLRALAPQPASVYTTPAAKRTQVRRERVRVDVYDSTRSKPRRDFADVLRAATARLAS